MARRKKFSLQAQTIAPLAAAGYCDGEIAAVLGVFPQSVQRTRRRFGIPPANNPGRRHTLNPETLQLMLSYQREGLSNAEIGRRLGIGRKAADSRLRRANGGDIRRIDSRGRLIGAHIPDPPKLHAIWEMAFAKAIGSARFEDARVGRELAFRIWPSPVLTNGSSMGWAAE